MDKFNEAFHVYTDAGAGGNHFVHRARMGPGKTTIDDASKESVHSGATAIKNTFTPNTSVDWAGWYFQNGVLPAGNTQPKDNWGDVPDAGVDLTGATELTFWARGAQGGEQVEFFAFGVGRYPSNCKPLPNATDPDSECKVTTTTCEMQSLGCFDTVTQAWQQFSIDLTGLDLSYVLGGFGWVTNAPKNSNQSIAFYLDDIQYNKARPDDLRFLCSYETLPTNDKDFNTVLRNVAFTYDNALALLAFLARGTEDDLRRAELLADAFVYALEHDRLYDDLALRDGLLRNAYQCGDLISPPGWKPNGLVGTARMSGFWDPEAGEWLEDKVQVGSHTGNIAWAMIAMMSFYEAQGGVQYFEAARRAGEWIEACCRNPKLNGGYTGGLEGWAPEAITWRSTEHNMDVHVAFMKLYEATGDPSWQERAGHARGFVESMWNGKNYFWTGTEAEPDPQTPNKTVVPGDAQTWAVLALAGDAPGFADWPGLLGWVELHCSISKENYTGIDFDCDPDGSNSGEPDCIWWEGTAHLALASRSLGMLDKWETYIESLHKAQATGLNSNGKGIPAANCDGLTTGFDWEYFARLHVGATAWFLLAELAYNPFCIAQLTPDPDSDGLGDCRENALQTDPADSDTDNDGCRDGQELGPNPSLGGLRDPLYFWDFFDTWATGSKTRNIDGFDIGAVVLRFGAFVEPPPAKEEALAQALTPPADMTSYHAAYDRGGPIPGENLWNLLPPSGNIDGFDIAAVVAQFGHTCA